MAYSKNAHFALGEMVTDLLGLTTVGGLNPRHESLPEPELSYKTEEEKRYGRNLTDIERAVRHVRKPWNCIERDFDMEACLGALQSFDVISLPRNSTQQAKYEAYSRQHSALDHRLSAMLQRAAIEGYVTDDEHVSRDENSYLSIGPDIMTWELYMCSDLQTSVMMFFEEGIRTQRHLGVNFQQSDLGYPDDALHDNPQNAIALASVMAIHDYYFHLAYNIMDLLHFGARQAENPALQQAVVNTVASALDDTMAKRMKVQRMVDIMRPHANISLNGSALDIRVIDSNINFRKMVRNAPRWTFKEYQLQHLGEPLMMPSMIESRLWKAGLPIPEFTEADKRWITDSFCDFTGVESVMQRLPEWENTSCPTL